MSSHAVDFIWGFGSGLLMGLGIGIRWALAARAAVGEE